jgi:glycosyltransferase involved in cell wall biosynthesis
MTSRNNNRKIPEISVIMPIYNVERCLARAMDSVLNQTYQNFELICVNDGSSDNSATILADYAARDKRIKVITQKNSGVSVARNNALAVARGRFIYFMDSDDYIHPQLLDAALSAAKKSGAQLVNFKHKQTTDTEISEFVNYNIDEIATQDVPNPLSVFQAKGGIGSAVWGNLFKRDLLNDIQFPDGITLSEDMLFMAQVLGKNPKTIKLDAVLYFYFMNPDSVNGRPWTEKNLKDLRYVVERLYEMFGEHPPRSVPTHIFASLRRARARIEPTAGPELASLIARVNGMGWLHSGGFSFRRRFFTWLKFKSIANRRMFNISRKLNGMIHPETIGYRLKARPINGVFYLLKIPLYILIYGGHRVIRWLRGDLPVALGYWNFRRKNRGKKVGEFIKPLAFYLTQYHENPENNEWWGKGFTEWVNVKKAKPLFKGHYQPYVPHKDIGYYDLSDVNVMRRQAEMAKKYGIYGFVFYYYYFDNGKRMLEKPLNQWLAAKDIDFPFCFFWANETWTRTWDANAKCVLAPQTYSNPEDLKNIILEMLPAFRDPRYIKVDGKPVLYVYRTKDIPNVASVADMWRDMMKEAGFPGIYLISVEQHGKPVPAPKMHFDAGCEFSSFGHRNFLLNERTIDIKRLGKLVENGKLVSRYRIIQHHKNIPNKKYMFYKNITMNFDDTARRGLGARIMLGDNLELFSLDLKNSVRETLARPSRDTGFLNIFAWNEWAEGAHLEPDEKYGYAWLKAVKKEMEKRI